ncbi:hypothetical protein M0R45_019145 [Rubus argutus]|uniref:Zinc knuckle CX2CX4HX4C domain-containing protein n=1 Tax=Rubus argutus TaxID=59490 RepID=A0AAW1X738_RUBAR
MVGGGLGNFLRIRVGIDSEKPLRSLATVRLPRHTSALVVEVEFEKLPNFCYFCGLLSHTGSHSTKWPYRKAVWLLSKQGGGWSIQAPDFPSSGLVRTRAEKEEGDRVTRDAGAMEVDVEIQTDEFELRPDGGKWRWMVAQGSDKDQLYLTGGDKIDCSNVAETVWPLTMTPFNALSKVNGDSGDSCIPVTKVFNNLNVVCGGKEELAGLLGVSTIGLGSKERSGVEPTKSIPNCPDTVSTEQGEKGKDVSSMVLKPKRDVLMHSSSGGKRGFPVGSNRRKAGSGGQVSPKKTVNMSVGRTPKRSSVIGPVSIHHEQ